MTIVPDPEPTLPVAPNRSEIPAAQAARTAALIAAGVPKLYAEKLAIDACLAQAWHDNPAAREGELASPLSSAEQQAKTIAAAHKVDAGGQ